MAFALPVSAFSQVSSTSLEDLFITKQQKEYRWDENTTNWQLAAVIKFTYNYDIEGLLTEQNKFDALSGAPLSRVVYTYGSNQERTSTTVFEWKNEQWVGITRYLYEFDSNLRESGKVVQGWDGSMWKNNTHDMEYIYDENGLFRQWSNYRWKNEQWVFDYFVYMDYNDRGWMIKKFSIRPVGNNLSQVFYEYNQNGKYTVMYAQFWRNGAWENSWKRLYDYDDCGMGSGITYQSWINGQWINTSRIESELMINPGYSGKKVPLCHNGHTIWVSKNAVPAHLAHGDCLGECLVEERGSGKKSATLEAAPAEETFSENSLRIYPNPAREQINVSLGDNENQVTRISLHDLSGRILYQLPVNGESELNIPRGNLQEGIYFLRLEGKGVENVKIIFE